jgi:hypothetical protein
MSFVVVFTASAMGFALLVPCAMVLVLLAYGSQARQELRAQRPVGHQTVPQPAVSPRAVSSAPTRKAVDVRRLAA